MATIPQDIVSPQQDRATNRVSSLIGVRLDLGKGVGDTDPSIGSVAGRTGHGGTVESASV